MKASPKHEVLWLGVLAEEAGDDRPPALLRRPVVAIIILVRTFVGVRDHLHTHTSRTAALNQTP